MIPYLLEAIVGIVFLAAGIVKAVDSGGFQRHLWSYRLLPFSLFPSVPMALIAGECGLGAALLLRLAPLVCVPVALSALAIFSGCIAWAAAAGRIEKCGCYNGWLDLSIAQGLLLDLLYAALLAGAWVLENARPAAVPAWKWIVTAALSATALEASWRSRMRPLIQVRRGRLPRG